MTTRAGLVSRLLSRGCAPVSTSIKMPGTCRTAPCPAAWHPTQAARKPGCYVPSVTQSSLRFARGIFPLGPREIIAYRHVDTSRASRVNTRNAHFENFGALHSFTFFKPLPVLAGDRLGVWNIRSVGSVLQQYKGTVENLILIERRLTATLQPCSLVSSRIATTRSSELSSSVSSRLCTRWISASCRDPPICSHKKAGTIDNRTRLTVMVYVLYLLQMLKLHGICHPPLSNIITRYMRSNTVNMSKGKHGTQVMQCLGRYAFKKLGIHSLQVGHR